MSKPKRLQLIPERATYSTVVNYYDADEMDAWLTDTVLPVLRRELKRSESSIHGPSRENDCIQCGAFADVRDIITELEDSHESAQGAT